jgi:mRNA interferase MazF
MPFEFGDVVLVPFPFTNQTGIKQRPAAIVSSLAYHRGKPDIVIMAIPASSGPAPRWERSGYENGRLPAY